MNINWKKAGRDLGFWFAELVAIFISVYLAFLLNGHRIHRQDVHKKQQIYTTLYKYFSGVHYSAKYHRGAIKLYVNPFLTAYKKKEMPRLKKWPFVKISINDHTWNAMLQSGSLDLLDIKLIQKISHFYGEAQRIRQRSTHFNRMSDTYLLPYLNADISRFYNTKTKEIKPQYEWYIDYLKHFQTYKNYNKEQSADILETLKKKMNKKQLQKVKADSAG